MLGAKMETLLAVAEFRSFTKAAEKLSLTQPAVSHHISQLEEELGAILFLRGRGGMRLTPEGEIAVRYARRFKALETKLHYELANTAKNLTNLRIGITHTSESNLTTEVLAKCSSLHRGLSITIETDTINNLYEMLENYEIDLAIVEGTPNNPRFSSLMLDTDYLVCIMSNNNPLSRHGMVTLSQLKEEQMILRLPSSATRILFDATLRSINDSIDSFNVTMEVDNIATIKDLIRKDLGVSILPKSACMDELRKGKLAALPIENLSMARETRIVYNKDFAQAELLEEIVRIYQQTAALYH
ncbi:MAG: LysR family transcriptional regulator [Clostridia bacterium]|nr:LysR family transcriptional regulator [Clostridia bacterium]MBQ6000881.1 LysR family transcriptional regulator [Clostridia bacterium]MBQ6058967.1 LysR family transcriptional regulator [Clostridia bacterium]